MGTQTLEDQYGVNRVVDILKAREQEVLDNPMCRRIVNGPVTDGMSKSLTSGNATSAPRMVSFRLGKRFYKLGIRVSVHIIMMRRQDGADNDLWTFEGALTREDALSTGIIRTVKGSYHARLRKGFIEFEEMAQ